MKKKSQTKPEKKTSFWTVFWFIVKITFLGFGGGNALFPIIKREAVDKHHWITNDDLDNILITTNMLPGASVPEAISYIAISVLGKVKGIIVTVIALLPHIFLFFGLFVAGEYIPKQYLNILYVAVIPVIIATLIHFVIRYIKQSKKELTYPVWIGLFIFSTGFCFFVPSPYNIAAIVIVLVILAGFSYEFIKHKKNLKLKNVVKPERNEIKFKAVDLKKIISKNIDAQTKHDILIKYFINVRVEDIDTKYEIKIENKEIILIPINEFKFIEVNHD
ncbi:MAG: chromate transporter [Mycoplasma sp.]